MQYQVLLQEIDKGSNLTLVGPHRSGKTTLLKTLAKNLQTTVVFIDMQRLNGDDPNDFYKAFCGELSIPLCRGYDLHRAMRGKRIVLLLDETELLVNYPASLRSELRGLTSDGALSIVAASTRPLNEVFEGDDKLLGSPFHNIFMNVIATYIEIK